MASSNLKNPWNVTLTIFLVTNIAFFGAAYGAFANQMENVNISIIEIVKELKITNQVIINMKEADIRLKLNQEYAIERIERIESKIK